MTGSAVVPLPTPVFPKLHEVLTLLAFAGLCVGLARLTFFTVERAVFARVRGAPPRARLFGAGTAGLAVAPVVLAGLAQAYVFYVLPQLHWVGLSGARKACPRTSASRSGNGSHAR